MIKIINEFIPFNGFVSMTIFPFIFIRKDKLQKYTKKVDRHELIHVEQQKEMLLIFFYMLYITEWLIRLICCLDTKKAYKNISLEREAYENELNSDYLKYRKHYSWIKYLLK